MYKNTEYIAGRNLIVEALKAQKRNIHKIFIENSILLNAGKPGNDARISDIISIASKRKVSVEVAEKNFIKRTELTLGIKSEGVIGLIDKRSEIGIEELLAHCKNKELFIVIINNILYEENLGAIIRTAAAGGVDAIIIPKRNKRSVTPKVERVSMGGSEYVPLIKANLFEAIEKLTKVGVKIIGVDMKGNKDYFDIDMKGAIALLLGGEDAGVSDPLLKRCHGIVNIPMTGRIQSLNVSVSTAIVIYEKVRQECQN